MADPRLLVIIGSGEMAPRMARVQRWAVNRLAGARPAGTAVRAAIIDTPYAFQLNAAEISAHALDFFERRLRLPVALASYRRADGDALARETALARIREADYVFSGPGSPSYALGQWSAGEVGGLLVDKLARGGALVFASAAALTLGRFTVPVYEIYKAGQDPHWLPGLDVLAAIGISAAVMPHFDNAEGAGHDTRYCFVGEPRLVELERQLPDDAFILGVDEHTALVIDVGEGRASVEGRGGVTLRRRGASTIHGAGATFALDDLRGAGGRPAKGAARSSAAFPPPAAADEARPTDQADLHPAPSDLLRELLALEDRPAIRARLVQLGDRLQQAEADRARLIEPLIGLLVEIRRMARARGEWAAADEIRDRLVSLGVRLADDPDGTTEYEVRSD